MTNSSHATSLQQQTPPTDADSYLGRAIVRDTSGGDIKVGLPSGEDVAVELAVPYGYRPQANDEVVVVGENGRYFVIGVTKHAEQVELRFHGDVTLRSSHGQVRLAAAQKLSLMGAEIEIRSKSLSVVAEKIVETATTIYQHARQLMSLRAGEKREVIEGDCNTQAERMHLASEEVIKVNGREIHLG
jgi:hypothetical protein